jgi:hypothetical protein
MSLPWNRRLALFAQRFWQPTSACMSCMPGGLEKLWSAGHWALALQTGLVTGLLAVALTFTPAGRLFGSRLGNAVVVALLTTLGDAWSHANHYGPRYAEALLTGAVSGLLAFAGSYVLEDRARRVRAAWARLVGRSATKPLEPPPAP